VFEVEHYMFEPAPFLDRAPEPDDFLLYPVKRTQGLGAGMTCGNMHRARHTSATDARVLALAGESRQRFVSRHLGPGNFDCMSIEALAGGLQLDVEALARVLDQAGADREERAEPRDWPRSFDVD
jgi:hypothetical protein